MLTLSKVVLTKCKEVLEFVKLREYIALISEVDTKHTSFDRKIDRALVFKSSFCKSQTLAHHPGGESRVSDEREQPNTKSLSNTSDPPEDFANRRSRSGA